MTKRNYHYIVAGLADLIPDQSKLPQQLPDFISELKELVHPADACLIDRIFLDIDNRNLLNLLLKSGEPFQSGGKYSLPEMEQSLREPAFSEPYLNRFILAYQTETPVYPGLSWEDQLAWLYYEFMSGQPDTPFLSRYYGFDQQVRNIATALNTRKFRLKDRNRYIGEDFVTDALKQSTLKDFGLAGEFPLIDQLLNIFEESDLIRRERAVDQIRWAFLDELNTFNYFTVEVILAHLIKLRMIVRWIGLDEPTGRKLFKEFIGNLSGSFTFAKEFEVKKQNIAHS